MPTPYTGNPDNFADPIDMPQDTDPPDAADVVTPLEGLLDDIAALAQGYQSSAVTDLNALAAINTTIMPDGAQRIVGNLGRFRLDKTVHPTFTEDRPAVVAPMTGTGRWYAQDIAKIGYIRTFTATGSWTCPPNISLLAIEGCGSGGGGGGGCEGDTNAVSLSMAGSGGGAGHRSTGTIVPSSGNAHAIAVAGGGAGGAGSSIGNGANGSDGATCLFEITAGPVILWEAFGGKGGQGGASTNGVATAICPGGQGFPTSPHAPQYELSGLRMFPALYEGDGGYTASFFAAPNENSQGGDSARGYSGGAAGVRGTQHTKGGGGGGGGGGAGPYGNGGAAGNGGDGASSGVGVNGSNGTAPSASTGAGGGGGGAGGSGTSGGSKGGDGAAGASGIVIIRALA